MTLPEDKPKRFFTIIALTPYPRHVDGILYESYSAVHDEVRRLMETDGPDYGSELFIMESRQKATRQGVLFETFE